MSKMMAKLLGRLYREETDGAGADLPGSQSDGLNDDIWSELSDGVEVGADEGGAAPAEVTDVEEGNGTPGDAETPTSTTPTDAAGAETPTETPATPEAQPEAATPTTPEVKTTVTPEQMAEAQRQFQEWETKSVDDLQALYAVSEEDAAALATEPETVLPKLAAMVHMNVMKALSAGVKTVVPQIMESHQQHQSAENAAKDSFFREWPELRAHEADVLRLGAVYRSMNPQATLEQSVKEIGEIVMKTKGLTRAQQAAAQEEEMQKPHRPATAGGGGGSAAPKPAAKGSGGVNWGELIED